MKKVLQIPIVSDANRPIMGKKDINWFLNLHKLMNIIFTNMIYRSDFLFIVRELFIVSCTPKMSFYIFCTNTQQKPHKEMLKVFRNEI